MKRIFYGLVVAAACCFSPTLQADLVYNGEFEIPGSTGLDTLHEGQSPNLGGGSIAAADGWFVWHNQNGSTETNSLTYSDALLPTIDSSQDSFTDRVIRVETSHSGNGLVQAFGPLDSGPEFASGSAWIYVTGPGQTVGVGTGNGGFTTLSSQTTTFGQWEQITFNESNSPVNEIVFYATGSGGAEFYVDRVRVNAVPEPVVAMPLLMSAFAGLVVRRRR